MLRDQPLPIVLRRIEKEDLPKLFSIRNDRAVYKWCRQNDVLHRFRHEKWYEWQATDSKTSMYAIENDQGIIGVCGLTDIDYINSRAEFSLYIDPWYQKGGFGRASLTALLNKAFNDYNLNSIWGETFDGNHAINLFHSLGFITDGTRRQFYFRDGKYIDAHLVSITREEWRSQKSGL